MFFFNIIHNFLTISYFLFVLNKITFQMYSISSTTIYKNILLQLLAFPFTKVEITIFI